MYSEFYNTIIEKERSMFNIKDASLKTSGPAVVKCHKKESLERGSTYLNYNKPEIRCAFMYRYASLHTGLACKYFREMLKQKTVKKALKSKKNMEICSLGGGPGIDIIGMFRAMAVNPNYHGKISRVSILDRCGGWESTFGHIMAGVTNGELKDIPITFSKHSDFKHEVIPVDLLTVLPESAKEIISNADIICMVDFVSVILQKKGSDSALKILGHLFKPGSVILFIDNHQGSVVETTGAIFQECSLETVLGPLHEKFVCVTKSRKDVYNCEPQFSKKFSIAGWIKIYKDINFLHQHCSVSRLTNDDETDVESDSKGSAKLQSGSEDPDYSEWTRSSSRSFDSVEDAENEQEDSDTIVGILEKTNLNTVEVQHRPTIERDLTGLYKSVIDSSSDCTDNNVNRSKHYKSNTTAGQEAVGFGNSDQLIAINNNNINKDSDMFLSVETEDFNIDVTQSCMEEDIDFSSLNSFNESVNFLCDKYTQTESDYFVNISESEIDQDQSIQSELENLLDSTSTLISLVTQLVQSKQCSCNHKCCCCMHNY